MHMRRRKTQRKEEEKKKKKRGGERKIQKPDESFRAPTNSL